MEEYEQIEKTLIQLTGLLLRVALDMQTQRRGGGGCLIRYKGEENEQWIYSYGHNRCGSRDRLTTDISGYDTIFSFVSPAGGGRVVGYG